MQNSQSATPVLNNSLSLQISSCGGHGGPVGTEHHGQKIVRHLQTIRSYTIIGHEKPARRSGATLVRPIASCGWAIWMASPAANRFANMIRAGAFTYHFGSPLFPLLSSSVILTADRVASLSDLKA
jgi:hypothetical protein